MSRRTHRQAYALLAGPHVAAPHVAAPLVATLVLIIVIFCVASPLTYAQATATAAAPAAATEAAPATATAPSTPGTPTPTSTPTLTPTATPTLTELQARLVLANTYLEGQDYERAAQLFAEIAEADRGNADALAGLAAALQGNASQMATLLAPLPQATPVPAEAAAEPKTEPSLRQTVGDKLREYAGVGIAALLLIVGLYLVANLLRWLLYWARELWYLRVLPLFGRPAVQPGYLIGEFANHAGPAAENATSLVPFALTDKLLAWNQLVQAKEVPVEPEPAFDLGGMGWLKVFWRWILPAPRGYRVIGALLPGTRGAYRLAVQRVNLARNSVERSAAFEQPGPAPEIAYRDLAGEAAKWLVKPQDMEAAAASMRGLRSSRSLGQPDVLSPSEIFDQALALLLPVRQQVNQGAVDFGDARERLRQAEDLLTDLPPESSLRKDLEMVIADLRKQVPGE